MLDVARFFDEFADRYSEAIRRSNPCYDAMLASAFEALPGDFAPRAILELGCGTGTQTLLLRARWPEAAITANDVSAEALAECERRVASPLVHTVKADMAALDFPPDAFDLVISSLATHHLSDTQKRALCVAIERWLRPGAWFVLCDRFRESAPHLAELHRRLRRENAFARGATTEEWERWSEHEREHDRPCSITDQLSWLRAAGFASDDCVWRRYMWATVLAGKSPSAGVSAP